ncbi:pre-rRNA-processing protein pno1 [Marasmius oreades]|uniref:Pre-rRNA-processing protein PNO1 n=1 Tax=Marasmius oreades TaxID=181124 RepID=A0A9P7S0V7_9AGAR|nr:pre-rRNA-processing protein pno1 [Marasmius oreades]KAG7092706.1 pre-rRNA-processing protein pno1 [Marasmius oreades]
MVVAHTQPSTSGAAPGHKKSRRKTSKKSSNAIASKLVDRDADMDLNEGSTITDVIPVQDDNIDDEVVMIDAESTSLPQASAVLTLPPLADGAQSGPLKSETRRIPIPPHRMTPLKKDWINLFGPLTEILGLQVRMNVQRRSVEIRTSKHTKEIGSLQKGADFVKAYALGFDVNDAIALLRLDDLYLDSFEIKDVKSLQGDHLSRAIGRIAGQDGKTKFTIENASRTRIVLADTKIHIMGSFQNIKIARDAIVSLILGSPPGKVYAGLRTVSSRMRHRAL